MVDTMYCTIITFSMFLPKLVIANATYMVVILILNCDALCRFPSSTVSSKSGKSDATQAKAMLTSGKNILPLGDASAQSQTEQVGLLCQ